MTIYSSLQGAHTTSGYITTGVQVFIAAADAAVIAEILKRGMHSNFGQPDHLYGQIDELIAHLNESASRVSGRTDAANPQPLD